MSTEINHLQTLCTNIQDLKCSQGDKGKVSCIYFDKVNNKHEFLCIHCILNRPKFFEENKAQILDIKQVFGDLSSVMDQGIEIPQDIIKESQIVSQVSYFLKKMGRYLLENFTWFFGIISNDF